MNNIITILQENLIGKEIEVYLYHYLSNNDIYYFTDKIDDEKWSFIDSTIVKILAVDGEVDKYEGGNIQLIIWDEKRNSSYGIHRFNVLSNITFK